MSFVSSKVNLNNINFSLHTRPLNWHITDIIIGYHFKQIGYPEQLRIQKAKKEVKQTFQSIEKPYLKLANKRLLSVARKSVFYNILGHCPGLRPGLE